MSPSWERVWCAGWDAHNHGFSWLHSPWNNSLWPKKLWLPSVPYTAMCAGKAMKPATGFIFIMVPEFCFHVSVSKYMLQFLKFGTVSYFISVSSLCLFHSLWLLSFHLTKEEAVQVSTSQKSIMFGDFSWASPSPLVRQFWFSSLFTSHLLAILCFVLSLSLRLFMLHLQWSRQDSSRMGAEVDLGGACCCLCTRVPPDFQSSVSWEAMWTRELASREAVLNRQATR